MATKDADILISRYLKKYKETYGDKPRNFNRYRARWGFADMAQDLGMDESKTLIDFYFTCDYPGHPYAKLLNWYEAMNDYRLDVEEDQKERNRLRQQSWDTINEKE